METFFRKYNIAIHLGVIAVGALLLALVANNLIASQLAPLTVPELPRFEQAEVKPAQHQNTRDQGKWVQAIVERCFFGCPEEIPPGTCPEGCEEGEVCQNGICIVEEVDLEDEEDYSDVPVVSDLNVRLLGCMVADRPEWSMALLTNNQTRHTHIVRPGDFLPDDVEVLEIHRDRVVFSRGGRLEFVKIDNAITGNPSPSPAASVRPVSGRTDTTSQRTNRPQAGSRPTPQRRGAAAQQGAVEQTGNNNFSVQRQAIERELADPQALARQARIIPNYKDGERSGLKLVGVTPNSVYSQLGIRTGDVLHSINGVPIENQRQALELLERMRRENRVEIEVERQGERQRMQYNIQ